MLKGIQNKRKISHRITTPPPPTQKGVKLTISKGVAQENQRRKRSVRIITPPPHMLKGVRSYKNQGSSVGQAGKKINK